MTVEAVGAEPIYYDPYDYGIDTDPHPVWRRMGEERPLYWNERYGFWALSRFEDVWSAYHDTATFSSSHGRIALAATLARFPRWEISEEELVMVRTSTVRGFSSVPVHLD